MIDVLKWKAERVFHDEEPATLTLLVVEKFESPLIFSTREGWVIFLNLENIVNRALSKRKRRYIETASGPSKKKQKHSHRSKTTFLPDSARIAARICPLHFLRLDLNARGLDVLSRQRTWSHLLAVMIQLTTQYYCTAVLIGEMLSRYSRKAINNLQAFSFEAFSYTIEHKRREKCEISRES